MYRPVLVTPPALLPISLPDAKVHCRVDGTDEDGLITSLVAAATSYLDGWTGILGRCLMPQTWRQDFDCFDRRLRIPFAPVTAIASVTFLDTLGATQTVDPASYSVREDDGGSYVRFANAYAWPSVSVEGHAVSISFVAGYPVLAGDPEADPPTSDQPAIPAAIRQAMLLMIGHWYQNRETVNIGNITTNLPMAADALLAPFRRVRL
jgi:uncharacterized phiE125 gp8 family phage protein